jgi:hypothetical protein
VDAYGDLLLETADIAAEEVARADSGALVVTGAVDMGSALLKTTEYMIATDRGDLLRRRPNVVIGVHQYPYFNPPPWLQDAQGNPLNCSYFQPGHGWYWLPEGCETAPPFEGVFKGRPARLLWQHQDQNVDLSETLAEVEGLGLLDYFHMYDTELHAGWHDGDGDGDLSTPVTTTPAREALAGLRIGAINAHQKVIGTEFIFAPADPTPYNLLVKALAGATPVYTSTAPLIGSDYSGLVYKLFTRPVGQVPGTSIGEDIIALWSNAEAALDLALALRDPTCFQEVTLTRFADSGGPLTITAANLSTPPTNITVQPLREFYFLSVISDRPGFGWLDLP